MWHVLRRRRYSLSAVNLLLHNHVNSASVNPKAYVFPLYNVCSIESRGSSVRLCSSSLLPLSSNVETLVVKPEDGKFVAVADESDDSDRDGEGECDEVEIGRVIVGEDELVVGDVNTVMDALCDFRTNLSQVKSNLDKCGVTLSSELVMGVLTRSSSDWEVAYTFFLWAGDRKRHQPGYAHSLREYHAMIYILGKARKFDTAWALIDEMRAGKGNDTSTSLVTPHTLLIMIRRYSAVHNVGKAINTFYAHKKFGFVVGIEEFHNLLNALCRYKNVEDAETLLSCNRNVFPLNTKSFNIILNGWCNLIPSPREGERFWMKMIKWGIRRDAVSYATMIYCYSKCKSLSKVLKLFDQMKKMNISPDRKVYNAVIHALAKARHVKEAFNLLERMEEKGINPNTVTYNSLIKPLCKTGQLDAAREVFDQMLRRGLAPTVQTYHAFFRTLRTGEEVFMLLEKMNVIGCQPNIDTYIMLIRKFCRWRQMDNVFKLWNRMSSNGICPDRSAYVVLIHGLFLNGKLDEAYKYYTEMKEKKLIPEASLDEKLQAWVSGKAIVNSRSIGTKVNQAQCVQLDENDANIKERKFVLEPSMDELHVQVPSSPTANSDMRVSKAIQTESSQFIERPRAPVKNVTRESDLRRKPEIKRVIRKRGVSFWE